MGREIGDFLSFPDWPEFRPNMTPREIFSEGSFGGSYWRPIFSSIISENLNGQHLEFKDWWIGLDEKLICSEEYDKKLNKYSVSSGTSLEMWESKGWIREQDPYGWIQWYCRFFSGRRSEDDNRQIRRWNSFAGPKGRFRIQLINRIIGADANFDDERVSPVIRQSLQHWAYRLTLSDFEDYAIEKWKSSMPDE
ncbi:MAG: hypothetical protein CMA00_003890 [Methanobacteriota archaeon]|nr:MAG: hypothetical protein CMA00_003890 [Euryarchaeota archaeon]|tara:strand:+ start:1047 stop:1628 length:582 start_codon:yes stop_codon:yes gene_type:complete